MGRLEAPLWAQGHVGELAPQSLEEWNHCIELDVRMTRLAASLELPSGKEKTSFNKVDLAPFMPLWGMTAGLPAAHSLIPSSFLLAFTDSHEPGESM